MMLQKLPDTFYSENQLRAIVTSWIQSNSLLSFRRLIPFFFEQLTQLDSPTDVWFVRDIVYNSGKEILEKEKMLAGLASTLSDRFLADVYSELKGVTTALEFVTKLYAIAAEIRCAELIKQAGVDGITKCTTPADVSCTYDGTQVDFQVKFKSDEDFTKGFIEEAIIGEMYKQTSQTLRDFSDFSVLRCTQVREGFRSDSIAYIHSLLCDHLRCKIGSHATKNLNASLTECDSKLYLDVNGLGKYEQSSLTISFKENASQMFGSVKVASREQEPENRLWEFLGEKIKQVRSVCHLVGWLDLEMSFQFDDYLSNKENQANIIAFLENYSIPLVLCVKAKFGRQTALLLSNKAAMTFPLIKILASKEKEAGVT